MRGGVRAPSRAEQSPQIPCRSAAHRSRRFAYLAERGGGRTLAVLQCNGRVAFRVVHRDGAFGDWIDHRGVAANGKRYSPDFPDFVHCDGAVAAVGGLLLVREARLFEPGFRQVRIFYDVPQDGMHVA